MASNLRRTDDLQRLRARELVLQNADGSFPTQGQVMIAGNDGRVEFTPVFSLDTSGNMMIPGNIYVGGDVVATGLYVNGPFSVNISHIIAGDLSAGSAVVGTLDASAATMTDLTVDRVHVLDYIDDANQITSLNTNLVRAVQVLAGSEDPNDQPTVGTALDVSGAALVRAGLTVAGVLSISGGLDTSGNLGVGGALTVDGSANIAGHLAVDGSANVFGRLYVGGDGLDDRGLISVSDNSDSLFKFRNKGHVGAIFNTLESTGAITTPTLLFDGSENKVRLVSTDASAHPILVADGTGVDVGGVFSVAPQTGIGIGQLLVEDVCGTHLKLDQAGSVGRILETDVATGTPQTPFLEFNGTIGALRVLRANQEEAMRVDGSGAAFSGEVDIVGPLYVGPNGDRGLIAVEDSSGTDFKMRNKYGQGELFVSDINYPYPTLTPILQCDANTNSFNIYDSSRNSLLVSIDSGGSIQCNSITLWNVPSSGVLTYDAGELKVNGVPVGGGGVSTTPLAPMTVAVGSGGPRIIYNASTSPLSGNWYAATLPGGVNTVYCTEWNGKYWLALTDAGPLHSLDGITWTQKMFRGGDTLPTTPTTATLASNGDMWLAGYSGGGGGSIYASTDGITWWQATTTQTATYGFFWTGTFWFAMGTASDPLGADAVMKSIDGFSWEPVPTDISGLGVLYEMTTAYGMASDGSMNIVVGENTNDPLIKSRILYASVISPVLWTPVSSYPAADVYRCVAYNGSIWVIGGNTPQLAYSMDGIVWITAEPGPMFPIISITWSGSFFVAVGPSNPGPIYRRYYSTDGITWANSSSPAIEYTCTRSNNIWKTPPATFSSTDLLNYLAANGGLTALASYIGKQSATYL